MSKAPRPTWFATLRRDSLLFALVGCLVLLVNALQPLAAAQAVEGGHGAICTLYGAVEPSGGDQAPSEMPDDCPICLSGNACSSAAPAYKAVVAFFPAFPAPEALTAGPVRAEPQAGLAERPGDPPPAIRAPPLSA